MDVRWRYSYEPVESLTACKQMRCVDHLAEGSGIGIAIRGCNHKRHQSMTDTGGGAAEVLLKHRTGELLPVI